MLKSLTNPILSINRTLSLFGLPMKNSAGTDGFPQAK